MVRWRLIDFCCLANGFQQCFAIERLVKKGASQALRLVAQGRLVLSGDENDWLGPTRRNQKPPQFQSRKTGQVNVQHQTSRGVRRIRLQQLFRGRKADGLKASRSQEPLDGLAHRGIVFNNDDRSAAVGR